MVRLKKAFEAQLDLFQWADAKKNTENSSELEDLYQKYATYKRNEVDKAIDETNDYYDRLDTFNNAKEELSSKIKSVMNKVNGGIRVANSIDKDNSPKLYNMRGVRNKKHPSKFFADYLKEVNSLLGDVKEYFSARDLESALYILSSSIPTSLNTVKSNAENSLNFYKTDKNAADPDYYIPRWKEVISKYDQLLQICNTLSSMVRPLLEELKGLSELDPWMAPLSPLSVAMAIPPEFYNDYTKLSKDVEYSYKLQNLIFKELKGKIEKECPRSMH